MRSILQTEASECGLACLAMVADHFGYHSDLAELRRRFPISLKGATLQQLSRHAAAMNLAARPVRLELEELSQLACPAILHWDLKHFVVLKEVKRTIGGKVRAIIVDPAIGERQFSLQELSSHFTGVAVELTPTEKFEKKDSKADIPLGKLLGRVIGLKRALVQVMALAIALEIFAIVAPLFNQFVIDEVIVSGDRELLKVLAMGFGLLLLTQTAIGLARSWVLMRWSIDIGMQWSARLFNHLLRLPASYFEKRHLGDIVSRFGSIGSIQSTLTSLFVESALDGLMALFAFGMMLAYSAKLSLVVVAAVLLYTAVRAVFYFPLREATRERMILSAKENSNFLETIRAIVPLKLFGNESERQARWLNLKQDVINRDIKTQKLGIVYKISNTAISGAQTLCLFYFGSNLVMENALSVGMLMAFSSYGGTFSSRIFSLIDAFINYKMLSMHVDRLSDIVLEPIEQDAQMEIPLDGIQPSITFVNVKFKYAEGEPWVLDGVNLHIAAGQNVALVGPSGCGKSTLAKLMLGILTPNEGDIYVGNLPIKQLGINSYRRLVGTVMQDDVLLAGSILENISFFDNTPDMERIKECAKHAAIHDEIMAMPMGWQTLVGDMGSTLSGGQKQRVLLARALYKSPKILVLDEATSHLDVQNEGKVNQTLKQLELTRISIAHRAETIRAADRVIMINGKKVYEVPAEAQRAQVA